MTAAVTNTAFAGPWGVSFRTGRHLGRGREILPPMPIPMYENFTDSDLAAIFA